MSANGEAATLSDLGAIVRQFWADQMRGPLPHRIVLIVPEGKGDTAYFTLPFAVCNGGAQASQAEERRGSHQSLPECIEDILLTLQEHRPHPLTKTRLVQEMAKKGRTYGDTTITRYLAVLMEDGTIENPGKSARPPGYRLTDAPTDEAS